MKFLAFLIFLGCCLVIPFEISWWIKAPVCLVAYFMTDLIDAG